MPHADDYMTSSQDCPHPMRRTSVSAHSIRSSMHALLGAHFRSKQFVTYARCWFSRVDQSFHNPYVASSLRLLRWRPANLSNVKRKRLCMDGQGLEMNRSPSLLNLANQKGFDRLRFVYEYEPRYLGGLYGRQA